MEQMDQIGRVSAQYRDNDNHVRPNQSLTNGVIKDLAIIAFTTLAAFVLLPEMELVGKAIIALGGGIILALFCRIFFGGKTPPRDRDDSPVIYSQGNRQRSYFNFWPFIEIRTNFRHSYFNK